MHQYSTKSRHFEYRDGSLFAENIAVNEICDQFGTPSYIYSKQAILDAFNGYKKGLEGIPHIIAFAVKANGNVSILKTLAEQGAGADLTSGGELFVSLKAGISANKIVFSGVGKTEQEIREAIDAGILMFNVESEPELYTIARIAKEKGTIAPVSVRVNPNIDPKTHPKISTGLKEHKFGVPIESAVALYQKANTLDSIEIRGISAHIGSSLMDESPLLQALDKILDMRNSLQDQGISISHLDIGGGLGIQYEDKVPTQPEEYAKKLKDKIKNSGVTLILEPGRSIVGNSALLVSRVQYAKRADDRVFVVVDAGMNDLARPAIYEAFHEIIPVSLKNNETESVDVVGPICESSDVFGKQRCLPRCEQGDLIAICSAGAYGFAMASHYNGRIKPAEILVDGSDIKLIRQRETYEDLLNHQLF